MPALGNACDIECAHLAEWFVPGTVPQAADDWQRDGAITLPEEYAEWARQANAAAANVPLAIRGASHRGVTGLSGTTSNAGIADVPRKFRIMSPRDGDKYAIPAGVESRYATISLQATGGQATHVEWFVDGKPYAGGRWPLSIGRHVFRATSASGERAEAQVEVEP